MKKFFLFILTPFLLIATHGSIRIEDSAKGRDTILRILTHENLDGSLIEIKGGYTIKDPTTGKKLSSSFFKNRFYLSPTTDGIKWGKVFSGIHQIEISPKNPSTTFLINGIQYKGKVTAFDIASKIFLVVELNVDQYLKSILSGNFCYKDMHQTTLEALAISMRTNLYHRIANSTNPFWDIKASEDNFRGTSMIMINTSAETAVSATKDLIMIYNNKPFPTSWSQNCAGRTASYKVIFRKNAPCPPGVCVPFAQKKRPESTWKCSISKRDLSKRLEIDSIESIEPYKDSLTTKTYGIRFNGKNLTFRELTFLELQEMLGKERIQSNDFTIKLVDKRIEFRGHGKGHGVGICLLSAKNMAKEGKSTSRILSTFFPDTKIIKLEFVPQVFFEDDNQEPEVST